LITLGVPGANQIIPLSGTSGSAAVPDLDVPIRISAHGVNNLPREIVISASGEYTDRAWYLDNNGISLGNGVVYTVNAENTSYIYGKEYSLTFEGSKNGFKYSRTIRFTVEY
jgi:hypothetical protein